MAPSPSTFRTGPLVKLCPSSNLHEATPCALQTPAQCQPAVWALDCCPCFLWSRGPKNECPNFSPHTLVAPVKKTVSDLESILSPLLHQHHCCDYLRYRRYLCYCLSCGAVWNRVGSWIDVMVREDPSPRFLFVHRNVVWLDAIAWDSQEPRLGCTSCSRALEHVDLRQRMLVDSLAVEMDLAVGAHQIQ